jgi:O-antigen ligase
MTSKFALPVTPQSTSGAYGFRQESRNPGRNIIIFFCLGLIFIRFSMIHQLITYEFQVNLYLLYVFGIPALLAVFFSGSLARVFHYRTAVYWVLFVLWLLADVPFSSWKGGSTGTVYAYLRTEFLMLFVVGSVAITWRECRMVLQAIAAACVVNLFVSRIFSQTDSNDRLSLVQFSNVSNSNDFAGHLILVLPFLLWVAMSGKFVLTRILSILGLAWGTYLILSSASRGAAVAIVVGVIFLLVRAPKRLRLVFFLTAPLIVVLTASMISQRTLQRILTFSSENASDEAAQSSQIRQRLFIDSVKDTIEHPLFGVGPGQFSAVEGKASQAPDRVGLWYQTHNSVTQIASECGIPALILYLMAIGSTYQLLVRNSRRLQAAPQLTDLSNAIFCMRLAMVSFCTAILFLNFGYFFYLPAMAGIAIILDLATKDALGSLATPMPAPAINAGLGFQPVPRLTPRPLPHPGNRIAGQKI